MKQRGRWYTILLIIILVASLLMLVLENISAITGKVPAAKKTSSITGYLTQGSTYSNVTISYYLAILMSSNLTAGIDFGTVINLSTTDQNATGNYNATNMSQYNITVSTDSNTAVDFCTRANEALKSFPSGLSTIGLGNETYNTNVTMTNLTLPSQQNQKQLNDTYGVAVATNVPVGNSSYWRFWLDVPVAQAAGNYNNTVYFKGVQTTLSC